MRRNRGNDEEVGEDGEVLTHPEDDALDVDHEERHELSLKERHRPHAYSDPELACQGAESEFGLLVPFDLNPPSVLDVAEEIGDDATEAVQF